MDASRDSHIEGVLLFKRKPQLTQVIRPGCAAANAISGPVRQSRRFRIRYARAPSLVHDFAKASTGKSSVAPPRILGRIKGDPRTCLGPLAVGFTSPTHARYLSRQLRTCVCDSPQTWWR